MNWDHLRVFLAVAREGQLLGAARKLGLNHATVARRLDALEASLGTVLVDRRPDGSTVTAAGERLLTVAERVEAEVLGLAADLSAEAAAVSGTVRVGAPDGLGTLFLARELGRLAVEHPGLSLELVPLPRAFSLSRREADIAISLDRPTEGRLVVSKLTDYTLGVYAAEDYLARAGRPETLDDLAGHLVVTGVEDFFYAAALDYTAALKARAARLYRCASVIGQMEAVAAGVGIGILHDFAAAGTPGLARILPETVFRRSYHMLTHPDTHDVRRVSVCRSFISRRIREERARFLR